MNLKEFDEVKTHESDQLLAKACQCFSLNPIEIIQSGYEEQIIKYYKAIIDYDKRVIIGHYHPNIIDESLDFSDQ